MIAPQFTTELHLLSQLVIASECGDALGYLAQAGKQRRAAFHHAAQLHHVVVRAFQPLSTAASACGKSQLAEWAREMLSREEERIANVLSRGHAVCGELEQAGYPTVVIKSLDHWPDLGNDLDLYTSAGKQAVRSLLERRFKAVSSPPTWSDRLAGKCSYRVPGMRATVEVHHGRLGQTGEHRALARRFIARRIDATFRDYRFMVPAPEEQVVAATLQRMYRHFYFRICDIVNTAGLVERGKLDFAELHAAAASAGILAGVSSFLKIVATYVRQHGGRPLHLPVALTESALFDRQVLFVRGPWLRVPLLPTAAPLYSKQVATMLLHGDLNGTLRLGLLPPLASAAKMAHLITGNHRGIW